MTHFIFKSESFKELDEILKKTTFPEDFGANILEIQVKTWFVFYSFQRIISEIHNENYVEERIKQHKKDLFQILQKEDGKGPHNIWFENRRVLYELEVLFFEMKSFLDLIAISIAKLFSISGVRTFGKDGNDPGGRFINILERNTPKAHQAKAKKLVTIFNKHKKAWINECVWHRDKATHHGTLQSKTAMAAINLKPPLKTFKFSYYFDGEKDLEKELGKYYLGFLELFEEVMQVIGGK